MLIQELGLKNGIFPTIYDNGLGGFAPLDHQFWVRGEPVLVGDQFHSFVP
jgi:hypothetical protein